MSDRGHIRRWQVIESLGLYSSGDEAYDVDYVVGGTTSYACCMWDYRRPGSQQRCVFTSLKIER